MQICQQLSGILEPSVILKRSDGLRIFMAKGAGGDLICRVHPIWDGLGSVISRFQCPY